MQLQYLSFAIPGGGARLLSHLQQAMPNNTPFLVITNYIYQTLRDWVTIIQQVTQKLTHANQLVSTIHDYDDYRNASKLGTGGVWTPRKIDLSCAVLQVAFTWKI
eukprot:1867889-Ditylum_brightwellii.AAC.1